MALSAILRASPLMNITQLAQRFAQERNGGGVVLLKFHRTIDRLHSYARALLAVSSFS